MSISTQTQQTMLSTEIVKIINDMREEGEAELRHDHFMAKVEKVRGADAPKFRGIYLDAYKREKPCYALPKREANLMVMSESYKVQAAVYDKMVELESEVKLNQPVVSLADAMAGMEIVARMLKMCPSSTLALASDVLKIKAPELVRILPGYAIDAPTTSGSSLVTFAASTLLKENGSPMSTQKFNILSESKGFIVELERPSTTKGTKKFKSLTEKGLKFGKNLTSPQNPRETTPHYYSENFNELLEALC